MPALKFSIDSLQDTTSELRHLYTKGDDGKFTLQVEGDTRLDAFRSNNRALNTQVTDLQAKLAALETAADPVKLQATIDEQVVAGVAAAVGEKTTAAAALETQLASEKAAHDATRFAHLVGSAFMATQGQPTASAFVVEQAKAIFQMKDGVLVTKEFSAVKPGEKLDVTEWLSSQMNGSLAYCWQPSRGGGAPPRPNGGAPPQRVVNAADPYEFGKNLEDIASGKVSVR